MQEKLQSPTAPSVSPAPRKQPHWDITQYPFFFLNLGWSVFGDHRWSIFGCHLHNGAMVNAAVAAGAKGIIIQALGWGNVNKPMYAAIKEAISKGTTVAISTRVPNGRVLPAYGFEGGGKTLQQAGAIFADNLSPQKSRILLMLAMQSTNNAEDIQKLFDK